VIRHGAGARPEKGKNLAIAEWPTASGPADYVLFAGLTPLGTVEAKRRNLDVSGSLQQANRYSRDFGSSSYSSRTSYTGHLLAETKVSDRYGGARRISEAPRRIRADAFPNGLPGSARCKRRGDRRHGEADDCAAAQLAGKPAALGSVRPRTGPRRLTTTYSNDPVLP